MVSVRCRFLDKSVNLASLETSILETPRAGGLPHCQLIDYLWDLVQWCDVVNENRPPRVYALINIINQITILELYSQKGKYNSLSVSNIERK